MEDLDVDQPRHEEQHGDDEHEPDEAHPPVEPPPAQDSCGRDFESRSAFVVGRCGRGLGRERGGALVLATGRGERGGRDEPVEPVEPVERVDVAGRPAFPMRARPLAWAGAAGAPRSVRAPRAARLMSGRAAHGVEVAVVVEAVDPEAPVTAEPEPEPDVEVVAEAPSPPDPSPSSKAEAAVAGGGRAGAGVTFGVGSGTAGRRRAARPRWPAGSFPSPVAAATMRAGVSSCGDGQLGLPVRGLLEGEFVLKRGHTNLAGREQRLADHDGQERSHHDGDGQDGQHTRPPARRRVCASLIGTDPG